MDTQGDMTTLKVFLCGAGDVLEDMTQVEAVTQQVNGALSNYVGLSLLTHFWKHDGGGLAAQDNIFKKILSSDLVIFLFYRKLGELTAIEFERLIEHLAPYEVSEDSLTALGVDGVPQRAILRMESIKGETYSSKKAFLAAARTAVGNYYYRKHRAQFLKHSQQFSEEGRPALQVCFKHVPHEYERHADGDYLKIVDFKASLNQLGSYGLLYHTYRNEEALAQPFASNEEYPRIESLSFQMLSQFLVRSAGLIRKIINDEDRVAAQGLITEELILRHWDERASRPGLGPVTSSRYPPEKVPAASSDLVSFVLERTSKYFNGRSIIELGSGIGRFTSQLVRASARLTAVDMCPAMKQKLASALGKDWHRIRYIESFVEDLSVGQDVYDCAFSCLLFVHIVEESRLKSAIGRIKRLADKIIMCEHVDTSAQSGASNFTRIWPLEKYVELFSGDFELSDEYDYNYLGDRLKLLIFERVKTRGDFNAIKGWLPKSVLPRGDTVFPEEWRRWYHLFEFAGIILAYEHFLGSFISGDYEFSPSDLEVERLDARPYVLPGSLKRQEGSLVEAVRKDVVKTGYDPKDQDKVRIEGVDLKSIDPVNALPGSICLTVRPLKYFEYLIVKKALGDPSQEFREEFTAFHPLALAHIGDLKSTNIGGCGLFVITGDEYVILSHREKVAEYPGTVSYSASGSMSWTFPGTDEFEVNPFITIAREAHEELGVRIDPKEMVLYSVGLDVNAFFVQFTFCAEIGLFAEEVLAQWSTAVARYEQEAFAVPLEPALLAQVVVGYSMEPAAKATLIQLCCKRFGRNTFARHLERARNV